MRNHPILPLFHQPWWLDATGVPWQAAEVSNGAGLVGYWPYTVERKLGVSINRNPPLTPYLGPVIFPPENLKPGKRDSFEHATTLELLDQIPKIEVHSIAFRPGFKQAGLLRAAGFEVSARQTFRVPLTNRRPEDILADFHEERRRNIRQLQLMLEINDESVEIAGLYHALADTLRRKNSALPYSAHTMQRLFEAAQTRGQSALWVARLDGKIQGFVWHAWDSTDAYYLASALAPGVTDKRVMTALIWQAIRHSHALGLERFDFEGSMDPGIEAFFRNFGGQRELYLAASKSSSRLWNPFQLLRR